MPKFPTFPTLYEDCKTVSISFLKKHGYLKSCHIQSGVITWSRNGNKIGSISIAINTHSENLYLELDYTCNDKPLKYRVRIVSTPSNLGKGIIWFFICPHTGKRCRKLHLIDGYFYHRSAFKGCFYEKQVQSKQWRILDNSVWGRQFKLENIYHQFYKKHFKPYYAGKPTKRFLKLALQAQNAGDNSLIELLK